MCGFEHEERERERRMKLREKRDVMLVRTLLNSTCDKHKFKKKKKKRFGSVEVWILAVDK